LTLSFVQGGKKIYWGEIFFPSCLKKSKKKNYISGGVLSGDWRGKDKPKREKITRGASAESKRRSLLGKKGM